MARVQIDSQSWGVVQDAFGTGLNGLTVTLKLADTATAATHYSAVRGGTSTNDSLTTVNGLVKYGGAARFIDEGAYDMTADGVTRRVNATAAPLDSFYEMPGVIRSTFRRTEASLTSSVALASGTLRLVAIALAAGDTVTNIRWLTGTTAAVTPTNQWSCLVDYTSLSVLRLSADKLTEAWAGDAFKSFTLSTPYVVPTSGLYWLGLMVAAATVPTLRTSISGTGMHGATPSLVQIADTGLTTPASLPATVTLSATSSVRAYADVT